MNDGGVYRTAPDLPGFLNIGKISAFQMHLLFRGTWSLNIFIGTSSTFVADQKAPDPYKPLYGGLQ